MVMDFAALPPEINSALMYAGAGSGPPTAGLPRHLAVTWPRKLSMTATSWESIISRLTKWSSGPVWGRLRPQPRPSLTSAVADHNRDGGRAGGRPGRRRRRPRTKSVFAATVNPALVASNRATLAALVATNFLGINTPAIMATQAQYAEMWVQDATAMYTYAASSLAAAVLQPARRRRRPRPPARPRRVSKTPQSPKPPPSRRLSGLTGIRGDLTSLFSASGVQPIV